MSWFLMQRIERSHLHAWVEPMRNACLRFFDQTGEPTDGVLAFNGGATELHFELDAWAARGKAVLARMVSDIDWTEHINNDSLQAIRRFRRTAMILGRSEGSLSKLALADGISLFFRDFGECHRAGLPIVIVETHHEFWTKYIKGILGEALEKAGIDLKELPYIFSTVTTPKRTSNRTREGIGRSWLLEMARHDRQLANCLASGSSLSVSELDNQELAQALRSHATRFGWLTYMYEGPGSNADFFLNELMVMIGNRVSPGDASRRLRRNNEEIGSVQARLKLNERDQRLLRITRDLMHLKELRKDATYFAFARTEGFWQAAADAIGRPVKLLRMLLPEELDATLRGSQEVPSETELASRLDCAVLDFTAGRESLLLGRAAAQRISEVVGSEEGAGGASAVIRGTCAVPGRADGLARVVNTPEQGDLLREGEILFSVATDPALEPAMRRAAAIVTDMGGITCHAAVVSRELGKPCVVGTRFASKVVRSGERVVVEATEGIVNRLGTNLEVAGKGSLK